MSNLDPYDVLGLQHGCTWGEVKHAYKKMCINTHPDRMNGNATYFMIVHEAFNKLQERHSQAKKFRNLPSTKVSYDPQVLTKADNVTPQKMKNFTPERFNSHFNKHKIVDNDPYAHGGYGNMMTQSTGNQREDIDVAKSQSVYIPKQSLVIYKEPECLPSSSKVFGDCYQLGNSNVNDYSGGGGTDIMQAYAHRPELVDTQVRYKSIDDITSRRSGESLAMTAEEQAYYATQERHKQKLEQYRLNTMNNESQRIANSYVQLHRRLT
jgi:hypothetical protein